MSAIDKDKLLEWINRCEVKTAKLVIASINSGTFDIPEPTVILSDGSVARVGDKVAGGVTADCDYVVLGFSVSTGHVWCREINTTSCFQVRGVGELKAYTEQDSWEKLEADIEEMVNDREGGKSIAREVIARTKALAGIK